MSEAPERILTDLSKGLVDKTQYELDLEIALEIADKEKEELMGLENAWPLRDILKKLIESSDILLHEKDYDGHGWELIDKAKEEAEKTVKLLSKHTTDEKANM